MVYIVKCIGEWQQRQINGLLIMASVFTQVGLSRRVSHIERQPKGRHGARMGRGGGWGTDGV